MTRLRSLAMYLKHHSTRIIALIFGLVLVTLAGLAFSGIDTANAQQIQLTINPDLIPDNQIDPNLLATPTLDFSNIQPVPLPQIPNPGGGNGDSGNNQNNDNNNQPPDADGDGVPDDEDNCPFVSGLGTRFGGVNGPDGCPVDSDGDGINDGNDRCPNTPGTAENNGCAAGEPSGSNNQGDTNNVAPLPTLPTGGTCAVATQQRVNVNRRQGPSTNNAIIAEMNPLSVYTGVQQSNEPDGTWYQLQSGGWVAGYVVRTNAACNALPVRSTGTTDTTGTGPSQPQVVTATPSGPQVVTATPSPAPRVVTATPSGPRVVTATPSQPQVVTATPQTGQGTNTTSSSPPAIVSWSEQATTPLNQAFAACSGQINLIQQLPTFTIANLVNSDAPCANAEQTLQDLLFTDSNTAAERPTQAILAGNDGNLYRFNDGSLFSLIASNTADTQPAISPDGSAVAYLSTDANGNLAVNIVGLDENVTSTLFTSGDLLTVQDAQPEWLSNQQLLVSMTSSGTPGIYRLNVNTTSSQLPTVQVNNASNPDHSAQLGMLAYQRTTNGVTNIFTAKTDGTGEVQVTAQTAGTGCHSPAFGGNRLYFQCDGMLYRYDTSGVNAVMINGGTVSAMTAAPGSLAAISGGVPFVADPTGANAEPLLASPGVAFDAISIPAF